jgi:hypothetical protein
MDDTAESCWRLVTLAFRMVSTSTMNAAERPPETTATAESQWCKEHLPLVFSSTSFLLLVEMALCSPKF